MVNGKLDVMWIVKIPLRIGFTGEEETLPKG
jgi:hypothetical protein